MRMQTMCEFDAAASTNPECRTTHRAIARSHPGPALDVARGEHPSLTGHAAFASIAKHGGPMLMDRSLAVGR